LFSLLFNGVQLLFAVAAAALIGGRFYEVLFRRQLEAKPYIEALRSAVLEERFDAAHRLVDAARPAWVAEFAHALLNARNEGVCVEIAVADAWQQTREEIGKGIYLIMGFARIASPLALFGVILQLAAGFASRSSVAALQAGMVESRAIESAIVTLMIGLGTSTICFVGGGILRKHVRKVDKELERMSRSLEEAFRFIDHPSE
jgi:biopolymer transport protein ExbB/TolQ